MSENLLFDAPVLYADVVIPLAVPLPYTYSVPTAFVDFIQLGSRVIVPLRNKYYTGIVWQLHHIAPRQYAAKPLDDLLDKEPSFNTFQRQLCDWISAYYLAFPGEVVAAALPGGLKLNSNSFIQLHPDLDEEMVEEEDERIQKLLLILKKKQTLPLEKVPQILGLKSIFGIIKELVRKNIILILEEVKDKYQPIYESRIKLHDQFLNQENLETVIGTLEKKQKQLGMLLKYLQQVPIWQKPELNEAGILKASLNTAATDAHHIKALMQAGIFVEKKVKKSRFDWTNEPTQDTFELSEKQKECLNEILLGFESKPVTLLHGITGSGKTEIYLSLIQKTIDSGAQALFLLPEIGLTTQLVTRVRKVFGHLLGVYHSRFTDNERVEIWEDLKAGKLQVILGVRSSLFLPFKNLGLIVVDEEHETSYKQQDPAPRYHARDTAIMLAGMHHAKVLLGSATPSLESYHLAKTKKWHLVTLMERYGNSELPEIEFIDIKKEKRMLTFKAEFANQLLEKIQSQAELGFQTILFKNRRGYSPSITCDACGWVPECPNCDVSLTYHLRQNMVRCHYCGYQELVQVICPACGSNEIKTVGYGTEKIEESIHLLLPNLRVTRMDQDTTKTKNSFKKIVDEVENEQVDILIGTQMVAKGFDFKKVNLVGIVDLDGMLHFPDFRATERTFQLVVQVSGRAGRRSEKGHVLIQTYNPYQPLAKWLLNHDYAGFFESELEERSKYHYPPFTRIIKFTLRNEDKNKTEAAAQYFFGLIRKIGASRILGPQAPSIERIRNQFHIDILLKIERKGIDLNAVKQFLHAQLQVMRGHPEHKKVFITVDVDPV